MTRLKPGQRYPRPEDDGDPDWPDAVLAEHRRSAVGDVPILVEMRGGGGFVGDLDQVRDDVVHLDDGTQLRCTEIEAFTLISEEPLDRSDELRGFG